MIYLWRCIKSTKTCFLPWSISQAMQSVLSFSSKNSTPWGNMDSRIRATSRNIWRKFPVFGTHWQCFSFLKEMWIRKASLSLAHVTHQLPCQQGHVFYDGETNPPLSILCQLHNGGQQWLWQLPYADHLIHAVQIGDDIQTHLRALNAKKNVYEHISETRTVH